MMEEELNEDIEGAVDTESDDPILEDGLHEGSDEFSKTDMDVESDGEDE